MWASHASHRRVVRLPSRYPWFYFTRRRDEKVGSAQGLLTSIYLSKVNSMERRSAVTVDRHFRVVKGLDDQPRSPLVHPNTASSPPLNGPLLPLAHPSSNSPPLPPR